MEPLDMILDRYPSASLVGLELAGDAWRKRLERQVGLVDSEDPDVVAATVLHYLIGLEIAALLREAEEFTAFGDISVKQGLAVRLAGLRTERSGYAAAAGIQTAASFTVVSGGTVTWVAKPVFAADEPFRVN